MIICALLAVHVGNNVGCCTVSDARELSLER